MNKNITLGRNISWGRRSLIYFSPQSKIRIGTNIVFSNSILNPTIKCKNKVFVLKTAILSINDNCGFSGLSLYCSREITIGRNLVCGGNVNIWDSDFHELNYLDRRNQTNLVSSRTINIGDDVFIGANCTILKGSYIGDRSILGAGSVLRGKIGNDELWFGNPAIFIKKIIIS